jgi:hypothetical protein
VAPDVSAVQIPLDDRQSDDIMNEMAREIRTGPNAGPKTRPTIQVADGIPRMRGTLAEFEQLLEVGILTERIGSSPSRGSWFRWRRRATGMTSFATRS